MLKRYVLGIHRLHDISDKLYELIKNNFVEREEYANSTAKDNRRFIIQYFRTGAPWRDLSPDCNILQEQGIKKGVL